MRLEEVAGNTLDLRDNIIVQHRGERRLLDRALIHRDTGKASAFHHSH